MRNLQFSGTCIVALVLHDADTPVIHFLLSIGKLSSVDIKFCLLKGKETEEPRLDKE